MPSSRKSELAELSKEIFLAIGKLTGQVSSPMVREKLAELVRTMNCYYSNLIEGHQTLPRDIERAQKEDFSHEPDKLNNQLLGFAHIKVEKSLLDNVAESEVYNTEFLRRIHRDFYQNLPSHMQVGLTKSGEEFQIIPGEFRDFMVDVGKHVPPHYGSLEAFLERFFQFYRDPAQILATDLLVAIAAAHHRLVWIHPFGDGNGRVARLWSTVLLAKHQLNSDGLWSLSRGLARSRRRYFEVLENADQTRLNDLDGRGNLTDRGLTDFCQYFLETILDQVNFMGDLLNLEDLRNRIEKYFNFELPRLGKDAGRLGKIVSMLAIEGQFPRSRVQEIIGKGETLSRKLIKTGLQEGVFESPSEKGPLVIAFPEKVLESYFPRLYIESR